MARDADMAARTKSSKVAQAANEPAETLRPLAGNTAPVPVP